ncbi:MAG: tetratricopeptide repeat protein [Cyclobacteriaceae bacterium]
MKKLTLTGIVTLSMFVLYGQDPSNIWNWPEDRATAEEKNVLYTDAMKSEFYQESVAPLEWLITEAPNLNPALYINGAKIYEALAEAEEDEAQQLKYQERALEMYDLRIEYFNNEAEVLNRKAFTAYKYWKGTKAKYTELRDMFKKVFDLNGSDVYDNNILAYFDVLRRIKLTGGHLEGDEVLDIYSMLMETVDAKVAQGDNKGRLNSIADNLDKMLTMVMPDIDCGFVEDNLGPKLIDDPSDLNLAKKIFQLLLTGKCTDSPLAVKSAEIVHEAEPTFTLAKFLASKYLAEGNYEMAIEYYNQALELADDGEKKGEIHLSLARLYASQGQKSASRSNAYKAVQNDLGLKEAYSIIGNLYMNSFEACSGGESRVKDRAVFIAAYEQYRKAGDGSGMANAKAQFPSIDEIFTEGYEEGQSISTGCWIGETVQLERRPAN